MLAQNFMTAEALGIPETHRQALMKTLVLLETGKLTHERNMRRRIEPLCRDFTGHFNMGKWNERHDCKTVCCIGGTADLIGDVLFDDIQTTNALDDLFFVHCNAAPYDDITPAQAAIALRSYLTSGAANWKEALAT